MPWPPPMQADPTAICARPSAIWCTRCAVMRAPEAPLRQAAATALSGALSGSGGIGKPVQDEMLKNMKHAIGERGAPVALRTDAEWTRP